MSRLSPHRAVPPTKAWGALLVLWSGLSLALVSLLDESDARVLAPLFAAVVGISALWQRRTLTSLIGGVALAMVFAAVRLLTTGAEGLVVVSAVVLATLLGVAALAGALSRHADADAQQHWHDAELIEELTPTQGGSEILKWQHASRQLSDELARGRRYHHPVSLSILGVDSWATLVEQQGPQGAQQRMVELARAALRQVRPMDRIAYYRDGELAVILPYTPLDGALIVMDKLQRSFTDTVGLSVRAGLAEFPTDAATLDELTSEADAALEFARVSSLNVVSRRLIETHPTG